MYAKGTISFQVMFVLVMLLNGRGVKTALHEVAQILVGNQIYNEYNVTLEEKCSENKRKSMDVFAVQKALFSVFKYSYIWEIKPEGYEKMGYNQIIEYQKIHKPTPHLGFRIPEIKEQISNNLWMYVTYKWCGIATYSFKDSYNRKIENRRIIDEVLRIIDATYAIVLTTAVLAVLALILTSGTSLPEILAVGGTTAEGAVIYNFTEFFCDQVEQATKVA